MPASPLSIYQQYLDEKKIVSNQEQKQVVHELDRIYHEIKKPKRWRLKKKSVKGLYIWGSVGVGKTFLMDLFYNTLPVKKKRLHFHAFMQWIHQQLKHWQGVKNPLQKIGRQLAKEIDVLCFDEFFVSNIADAMILAELLKSLFSEGICFIASSNIPPDQLYLHGLQRDRFLPAIEFIEKHTSVIHLHSNPDYRRIHGLSEGSYFTPLNPQTAEEMEKSFQYYAKNETVISEPMAIHGRAIKTIKRTSQVIWFDFQQICGPPRSHHDYLDLVNQYEVFLISNVPQIRPEQHHLVTNFIHLIDILYDHRARVVISAGVPAHEIYPEGKMEFQFKRTLSRLMEMQSDQYAKLA